MAIILCRVCEKNIGEIRMPSRISTDAFWCCQECFKMGTEPLDLIRDTFYPDFWDVPIWVIEGVKSFLDGKYISWSEAENYIMGNL